MTAHALRPGDANMSCFLNEILVLVAFCNDRFFSLLLSINSFRALSLSLYFFVFCILISHAFMRQFSHLQFVDKFSIRNVSGAGAHSHHRHTRTRVPDDFRLLVRLFQIKPHSFQMASKWFSFTGFVDINRCELRASPSPTTTPLRRTDTSARGKTHKLRISV